MDTLTVSIAVQIHLDVLLQVEAGREVKILKALFEAALSQYGATITELSILRSSLDRLQKVREQEAYADCVDSWDWRAVEGLE